MNQSSETSYVDAAGMGKVTVPLPVIVSATPVPQSGRKPLELSQATRSLTWTFLGGKSRAIALTAQTPGCKVSQYGLKCEPALPVAAGKGTLTLTTHASLDGSGKPLATASEQITVFAGQNNIVSPLAFIGLASRFELVVTQKSLTQGVPATVEVALFGIDSAGAAIPMTDVVGPDGKRVRWSSTFSGPYAKSAFPNFSGVITPSTPLALAYDGRLSGVEEVRAVPTQKSGTYATASISIAVGSSEPGSIFVWNDGDFPSRIPYASGGVEQFSASASGNAAPLRTYRLGGPPLAADVEGNFWSGPLKEYPPSGSTPTNWLEEYGADGAALARLKPPGGTVFGGVAFDRKQNLYVSESVEKPGECYGNGTIDVYSASSSWTKLTRQLETKNYSACSSPIAADDSGNIYVVGYDRGTAILEYGAGFSGKVKPKQVFALGGSEQVNALATDTYGNLYAIVGGQVLEMSSSSVAPSQPFPIEDAAGIAIDSRDNVYVLESYTIEEFAHGASTPARTITGPDTGLSQFPSAIVVAQ